MRNFLFPFYLLYQGGHRALPHLLHRCVNGRQGRDGVPGHRNVVEPHKRQIVGNVETCFVHAPKHPKRHGVIRRKEGCRPRPNLEKPLNSHSAALPSKVPLELEGGIIFKMKIGDRLSVSCKPLLRVKILRASCEYGDPFVPVVSQVLDGRVGSSPVIKRERLKALFCRRRIQENNRKLLRNEVLQKGKIEARPQHDESVDPTEQRLKYGFRFVLPRMRVRDEDVVTILKSPLVEASGHLSEKLAVHIGEKHPNGSGLLRAQMSRAFVRMVVQRANRLKNLFLRALANAVTFV